MLANGGMGTFATGMALAEVRSPAQGFAVSSDAGSCRPGASDGELPVKIPMAADPNPDPILSPAERDRAIVEAHSDGPCARVAAQPFQVEVRVRWVFAKACEGSAGGSLCL